MHVLVDGSIYLTAPSGGAFVYLNELLPRLSKVEGLEVDLLLPKGITSALPAVATKTAWVPGGKYFPNGKLKQILGGIKRQVESKLWITRLKSNKPLVFHSVYYERPPSSNWRVVSTIHDMIVEKFPQYYSNDYSSKLIQLKKQNLNISTRLIAVSHQTKRDMIELAGISADRIDVIHHGINMAIFNPGVVTASQRPYLLNVGGRANHKNFVRFLEAYASGTLRKDYQVKVAGFPWQDDEEALIKKWGLAASVSLLINPTTSDLVALYRNASAFVYPSLYEGFGIPLLEAMACGAPVVASGVGCLLEVGGDAVKYFDPKDIASIERKIREATEPEVARQLKLKGFERVKGFSWEQTARLTHQSYVKAIES